jgi:hypothetical protein
MDESSGKTYSTNNMTAAPGEFYSVDIYCTPLLRVKHMLVILALLLSFDAFFKGLYTQVQSDKVFRTQAYASRALELPDHHVDEMESFLSLLKTMFLVTLACLLGWLATSTTSFYGDFQLKEVNDCIVPTP